MKAADVIKAIGAVSQAIGQDLLPLFRNELPELRTGALPDAESEMLAARYASIADDPTPNE